MDISRRSVPGGYLAVEEWVPGSREPSSRSGGQDLQDCQDHQDHQDVWGGSAPVVVCSPAMGDVRDAFYPLAEELVQAGCRVVMTDLRGHGDSAATFGSYGDEATAQDLTALIEGLGVGPVVLVGASMSAASAAIVAGRRPDLVCGLVLMAPFLRGPVGPRGVLSRLVLRLVLMRPWGPALWRVYSAGLWPGLPDARQRAARLTRLLCRPGRWRAFQLTTRTDHRVASPWLPRATCPALVVMGTEDPDWKDPAAEATWAASAVGGVRTDTEVLMVDQAGHAPMLERPQPVAAATLDLIRSSRSSVEVLC